MKKFYLIIAGVIVSLVTITAVNAETTRTPNNPNNTLENKIKVIDQMVVDGELDKAKAEEIKKELENCDGTGTKKLGEKYNLQFGKRLGNGQGQRHNQ
jgi:polyhydroxyalkanoate synthesis regulator phasin